MSDKTTPFVIHSISASVYNALKKNIMDGSLQLRMRLLVINHC